LDDIDIVEDSDFTPDPSPAREGSGCAESERVEEMPIQRLCVSIERVTHLSVLSPTCSDWEFAVFGLGVL